MPLVILAAMVGTLLVVGIRTFLGAVGPAPPAWLDYRQDTFLGIAWRWSYDGTRFAGLRAFCPQCSTALRGRQQGFKEITTSFICDECHFVQDIPGSGGQVFDRIFRLIEREANLKHANRS